MDKCEPIRARVRVLVCMSQPRSPYVHVNANCRSSLSTHSTGIVSISEDKLAVVRRDLEAIPYTLAKPATPASSRGRSCTRLHRRKLS